ncbi:MAG TPA: Crp/Fnr family transcriptional regulator [Puia sp.]|nr:Crp/Fnr family transcriptional regulator [Puia sp.]
MTSYVEALRVISAQEKAVLESYFQPMKMAEGEELFEGGKTCDLLFFICKGVLKIHSANERGVDVIHYFYKEDQFCTILDSFGEGRFTEVKIQAACDAEVLQISKRKLYSMYERLPFMKDIIDKAMQQGLMEKVRLRNSYLGQEAGDQYKLFVAQWPDITLRVSVKDIASFLGITPQSLSRIRKLGK